MKKILTILGARPQFVKAAPVSLEIKKRQGIEELILHTGQHYDAKLSDIFFSELGLDVPYKNLKVGSGSHGTQTAEMLIGIEKELLSISPSTVIVYGDTNSTLAGALASIKLKIPLIHVEAGLRSFNRDMPEEYNRILTDHAADVLFYPSQSAFENLKREGLEEKSVFSGDTMLDTILLFNEISKAKSQIVHKLGLKENQFVVATIHRPYNTDNENLSEIIKGFNLLSLPVVFPIHPRTLAKIKSDGSTFEILNKCSNIIVTEPLGYLDTIQLLSGAKTIFTDSGGMQKEAFYLRKPCITIRPETEWTELIDLGWNTLCDPVSSEIVKKIDNVTFHKQSAYPYGKGDAARIIVDHLANMGL